MQKHISSTEIMNMEKQERVHFINSLGGFKSVSLIGTTNNDRQTNLAVFSSIFHIGANPALIAVVFRPSPPDRDTLKNILETGFYTINHINEKIYKQAHQTSARYDANISEFDATGLQPEYKNNFKAPFVKESNIQLGVEFREKIALTINNTIMIIGEIKDVYFPENCLLKDGFLDLEKANTITCSGLDSYHKTIRLNRLSYAKPDKEIT
ncbi:flavin reductase [Flavobacterium psychrophilum]|uniref:Flavin reductase like domain-containing protein n=3 Tax=Flavobacterium psychrophilum TaxID=96345 RepID=A6H179_FLAPJ|nr:flavin reductase [Flavobacterium psychrophilum]AIJ37247.1 Nitrilotriacetate monooxygenase component B [Flavobacterium psychrophilum]AIN71101.1 flavin oxidoreductase [Flavobacterium psychrophilum FPG101]AIN74206.1 flavin oxidoreductase [Flavobacterium psychrophilum FPG3]EKT2068578.1 flavin reductase [Flavobacterium psychrophilum]EKT2070683.1 flavin reductase [Flavobacterium psychrophilum]